MQKKIFTPLIVLSLCLVAGCGDGFRSFDNDSDSIDVSIAIPDELKGKELKRWLKNNYYTKKHKALSYKNARKELFGFVENYDGLVTCVYTGAKERSSYVTHTQKMDTEHIIPQSYFKSKGRMRSDLHHLFPTIKRSNNARSRLKFKEIDDRYTRKWFGAKNNQLAISYQIPDYPDHYSEWTKSGFEPMESNKGNVARAVFYFYTMYPYVGNVKQVVDHVEVLQQWNLNDPVDSKERIRNNRIERVQGNRNPFIDHPELIARIVVH